jgi:hypothetical protein
MWVTRERTAAVLEVGEKEPGGVKKTTCGHKWIILTKDDYLENYHMTFIYLLLLMFGNWLNGVSKKDKCNT